MSSAVTRNSNADFDTDFGYDSAGRLNRVTGPGLPAYGAVYGFAADSDLVSQIAWKSDSSTTVASTIRSFDSTRDLITSIENKWGATTVSKYEYTNDALARRTSVTVSGTAFTAAGTAGFDLYTYNDRNELASAKRYTGGTLENPTSPVYSRHFIYDYDPIGNREIYQIGQGTATTYTANVLNQYTQTADPSESFTYDDDGNLTQDGTYTYVWDAENRLIEIRPTSPGTNAIKFVYDYDYMGRRARRTQYGWTGSAWSTSIADQRIYLYDRWNNLIIYDADNGMAIGRKLTWGLDLSGLNGNPTAAGIHGAGGIGGLVAAWAPASPAKQYFCFYDANGNLSDCLKNSDGTRWSHFEYDPYGGAIVATDPGGLSHQFRYSTKFYQGAFGIYDYGYRLLQSKSGRWINRDRIKELGGLALYGFVFNATPLFYDALGRYPAPVNATQRAETLQQYVLRRMNEFRRMNAGGCLSGLVEPIWLRLSKAIRHQIGTDVFAKKDPAVDAEYSILTNNLYIDPDESIDTLLHELWHAYSDMKNIFDSFTNTAEQQWDEAIGHVLQYVVWDIVSNASRLADRLKSADCPTKDEIRVLWQSAWASLGRLGRGQIVADAAGKEFQLHSIHLIGAETVLGFVVDCDSLARCLNSLICNSACKVCVTLSCDGPGAATDDRIGLLDDIDSWFVGNAPVERSKRHCDFRKKVSPKLDPP